MIKPVMHTRSYRLRYEQHTKQPRRKLKRRLVSASAGFLALYILTFSFISPAFSLTPASKLQTTIPGKAVSIDWPDTGQAAIGAIGYGTIETHNTTESVPTASVIKTVAALSVLQKRPLALGESGPTITITKDDVARYEWYVANDGSAVPVREGQQLSEYQILEGMLVRSANNFADTLVIWAFGSLEAYRTYANDYVKQLGMDNTVVGTDASGLDPSSTSTAADLIELGQVAMKNPVIAEIVKKKSTNLPEIGTVTSTNTLLGTDGIIGIKTGTDYKDRGSYLFASTYQITADQPPITIIGSVMGAPTIGKAKADALSMLRSARSGFVEQTLFKAGQRVGQYRVEWASKPVNVITKHTVTSVDWSARDTKIVVNLKHITNQKAGSKVGVISIETSTGRRAIASAVLETDVPRPSLWWRLTHPVALLKL